MDHDNLKAVRHIDYWVFNHFIIKGIRITIVVDNYFIVIKMILMVEFIVNLNIEIVAIIIALVAATIKIAIN